jgi:hypothetical protein
VPRGTGEAALSTGRTRLDGLVVSGFYFIISNNRSMNGVSFKDRALWRGKYLSGYEKGKETLKKAFIVSCFLVPVGTNLHTSFYSLAYLILEIIL